MVAVAPHSPKFSPAQNLRTRVPASHLVLRVASDGGTGQLCPEAFRPPVATWGCHRGLHLGRARRLGLAEQGALPLATVTAERIETPSLASWLASAPAGLPVVFAGLP